MDSVFIAARAGVDENAAVPIATVAGPNNASLRVIVMGTSLSRNASGSLARRRGNVERKGGTWVRQRSQEGYAQQETRGSASEIGANQSRRHDTVRFHAGDHEGGNSSAGE